MKRRGLVAGLALVAGLVTAAPDVLANGGGGTPGIDECDWSSFRNGLSNPGSSSCDQVDIGNVGTLRPHVLYRTRDSVTATPAVVDGMLYVGAWDGTFYAFDTAHAGFGDPSFEGQPFATVEPVWTFQIDDTNGVSFGRIVSSASVVDVGATRLVLFAGGATVYALDATSGRPLASVCLDPRSDADAAPSGGRCRGTLDAEVEVGASPVVIPNGDGSLTVLVGQDNHNAAGIGRTGVTRLRLAPASDGTWAFTPEWKFDPEAGTVLTGADLLTQGSGTGDGCGGVWGTPAVDVAADLVVFGTASCTLPTEDPNAVAGEKVFGIRLSTGAPVWRFDPPRPWGSRTDDDFGASPQLFSIGDQLVAGAGGKDGWYYAIDATSGVPIWSTQVGQPGHANEDFAIGGVLGSPAIGTANGQTAIFVTTAISTPVGAPLDYGTTDSVDASLAEDPGRMLSLHAIDAATGTVLWRSPLTRQTYGHPTYTAGLVFVPSTAGFAVQAFDADTGAPVWTSPPIGATSTGVAVTGDGIFFGAGTRQTDAGFKLFGEDSVVPSEVQALQPVPVSEYVGADPQERLSGIWAFQPIA